MTQRECDFSGWMFKKGKLVKNWKQRWFELKGFQLEYYDTVNAGKPKFTIYLTKESKLEVIHDEDAPHNNMFLLRTQDRDWKFAVETRNERDAWMTQLRNNMPSNMNRSAISSTTALTVNAVEGYLEKTGKWNKGWKKRWCKLNPNQKQLYYYTVADDGKKTFKDKIDLTKVTVIDQEMSKGHPHGFVLVTQGRRYKFAASKPQELQKWFQAISPYVGGKQSLRDKQGLLQELLRIKSYPIIKSALGNIPLPDWLWHEVIDMIGDMGDLESYQDRKEQFSEDDLSEGPLYRPGLVVHLLQDTTTLSFDATMKLLEDARKSFLKKPLLIDVKGPIYVIGELNGDFEGLINIFETLGTPPETRYLFLGNIIGANPLSLGCALLLLAMKVYHPEHLYIIRGKMEDQVTTREPRGSLYDECQKQYGIKQGRELWKEFVWLFDHMPICAVLNETLFAVSSGLSQNIVKVGALRTGKIRPLYIARTNAKKYPPGRLIGSVIVRDFLYNVPSKTESHYKEQQKQTDRGLFYYQFGKNALSNFLRMNRFQKVIRSGQVDKSDKVYRVGHESFAENKLISINSSANYNSLMMKNKTVRGAVMFLEEFGEDFTFHTFKPDA